MIRVSKQFYFTPQVTPNFNVNHLVSASNEKAQSKTVESKNRQIRRYIPFETPVEL